MRAGEQASELIHARCTCCCTALGIARRAILGCICRLSLRSVCPSALYIPPIWRCFGDAPDAPRSLPILLPKLNSAPQEFSACLSLNKIPSHPVSPGLACVCVRVGVCVCVAPSFACFALPVASTSSEFVRPQARSRGLVMSVRVSALPCRCLCPSVGPSSRRRRLDPSQSRSISHCMPARYGDLRHPTHGRRAPSDRCMYCTSFFTLLPHTHAQ